MTAQVRQGHELFFNAGCTACHFNAAQMMAEAANSGLDEQSVNAGAGGARFRPPSLRNVALHPPFMHDGRFRTLEEVVDFYDSQVHDNPNLDPRMMLAGLGGVRRLRLEPDQRAALVEFLKSLTDAPLIADPRFSDPFAVPK
jgi:cytochrome c peroxidase